MLLVIRNLFILLVFSKVNKVEITLVTFHQKTGMKVITKGRFDALLKNYTKGRAMTGLVLRKNTAKNRKKYLK